MVNTIFLLEDVETPPAPESISRTLAELDPREREKEKMSGPVEELESINLDDQHPKRTIQIGSHLPGCLRDELISFLREHKDVFAWSHEDMPEINPSIIVHRLNIDPASKPVIQKHRKLNPERYIAINEKVGKLLIASFIREVHYPEWLANVVMVPTRAGGVWEGRKFNLE